MNHRSSPDAQAIADALSCGKPGCGCRRPAPDGSRTTHCPTHDDQHPSLSIRELADGRVLPHCFAGCSQSAIIAALQQRGLWSAKPQKTVDRTVRPATPQHPPPKGGFREQKGHSKVLTSSHQQPATSASGMTLEALAKAKNLPSEFLRSLGIADCKYKGQPSVRISYSDADRNETAVRFRLSLEGSRRFVWRRGDHVLPYGIERLDEVKPAGWVLLVEGESDCWTAWYHRLPALGIPGKATWKSEWAHKLEGLDVYLWQEPDASDLTDRVVKDIPSLRVLPAPPGIKDLSAAHLRGENIPRFLESLKANALSAALMVMDRTNAALVDLRRRAAPILESAEDPLDLIGKAIAELGYGGDLKPALICYLAATSRLLKMRSGAMPVHLLLIGPPSAGKSWTWGAVRLLLPEEAYHQIDAGSPRMLIYDREPLQHRVLAFGEADSLPTSEDNPAASAVRNLLQDHSLHYQVTIKNPDTGEFMVKDVRKEGPTVLITTSVRPLGEQLSTRLFTLEVPHDRAQLQAALLTQVRLETMGSRRPDDALIAFQGLLQAQAPWDVTIPFANPLAKKAFDRSGNAARVLRDFAKLSSLIKAVTLLRYRRRDVDGQGRLVSRLEDYALVKRLTSDMYEGSLTGVSAKVREVVGAVAILKRSPEDRVTVTGIARHLDTDKGGISRIVKTAIASGWLVNLESRKGHQADLAVGEPLPDGGGLPAVAELAVFQGVDAAPATPVQLQIEGGVAVLQPSPSGETPNTPKEGNHTDSCTQEVCRWTL